MNTPAPAQGPRFTDESTSVQGHLTTMQGVINRMATNSASAKAWCVTLVAAVIAFVADEDKPRALWVAAIPTVLFFWLDAYYLGLEKGFRRAYKTFVTKLHNGSLAVDDLYDFQPEGTGSSVWWKAVKSPSVWPVYTVIAVMIVVARYLIGD